MAEDQQRRRVDQVRSVRPPLERVALAVVGVLALAAALGGAWWLLAQSGVAAFVRDGSPDWSPDGRVIFASATDGRAHVCVTDRAGAGRHQLMTTAGEEGDPAFSVDGSHIVFHSEQNGNSDIYVMHSDGTAAKRLTTDPAIDRSPAWSRDGRQIVFMSNRANPGFDIFRMNADGTGVERLTAGGRNANPQYARNGVHLVLDIDGDVYIMDLSSRGLRRLTHAPSDGVHPAWSPDGERIAFASRRNGRSEIFVSRADGAEPRVVVTMPTGDALDPRWSPDGAYIAFVHAPDGADPARPAAGQRIVYIADVATGSLARISK